MDFRARPDGDNGRPRRGTNLPRRQRQASAALCARVELPLQSPPPHRRSDRFPAPPSRHSANHHLPSARRRRSNQRRSTCFNREAVASMFPALIRQLELFFSRTVDGENPIPENESLTSLFITGATRFKHPAFREEREVRIVG